MRTSEARPVALAFQAEYELVGLPAVADLSADHTTGPIDASVIEQHAAEWSHVPTIVGASPAAVRADVETAPVVNRSHHRRRRRLGVRSCRQICGRRGGGHSECEYTNSTQPKLPSCFLPPVACHLSPIATVDSLFLILVPTPRRNTRRLAPGLLCRIGNYPFFNCDENASSGTPGSNPVGGSSG